MAKLFLIDVSEIPTHEERYKILEAFEKAFDVHENWVQLDLMHRTFYTFEAFWPYKSPPQIPQLPSHVKIIEK